TESVSAFTAGREGRAAERSGEGARTGALRAAHRATAGHRLRATAIAARNSWITTYGLSTSIHAGQLPFPSPSQIAPISPPTPPSLSYSPMTSCPTQYTATGSATSPNASSAIPRASSNFRLEVIVCAVDFFWGT